MRGRLARTLIDSIRSGDSYGLVLAMLLASVFVGVAVPDETWARVLRDAVIAATAVVTYWTAVARRAFLVPRVVIPRSQSCSSSSARSRASPRRRSRRGSASP